MFRGQSQVEIGILCLGIKGDGFGKVVEEQIGNAVRVQVWLRYCRKRRTVERSKSKQVVFRKLI